MVSMAQNQTSDKIQDGGGRHIGFEFLVISNLVRNTGAQSHTFGKIEDCGELFISANSDNRLSAKWE